MEELKVQVKKTRLRPFRAENPDTLSRMGSPASIYVLRGRKEAKQLQVQVMKGCRKPPGAKHPDTLKNMANLAPAYWNKRQLEAEKLEVQVKRLVPGYPGLII